jgi:hypothetical protein
VSSRRMTARGISSSHVTFKDDKLISVYKTYATAHGDDAAKVVNTFFTQMRELQSKGQDSVVFDTEERNTASLRIREVRFWVGDKEFDLTVDQGVGGGATDSEVSFTETLYAREKK